MKGQISIATLTFLTVAMIGGIVGVYFRNDEKAQRALDGVSEIRGDLKVLGTKLDYLLIDKGAMYNAKIGAVVRVSTSSIRKF